MNNPPICLFLLFLVHLGRKNFLFHVTTSGAKASAIVLSIIETAKANQLNIFQYYYTLLLYMPDYKNESAGIKQPRSFLRLQGCRLSQNFGVVPFIYCTRLFPCQTFFVTYFYQYMNLLKIKQCSITQLCSMIKPLKQQWVPVTMGIHHIVVGTY